MAGAFTLQMPSVAHALATPVDEAMPSFDDVYGAHAAFVWRTLRVFGVPDAHIEDAVQDVFVVVHRRLPEWQARAAITTWLFAIARRVASTHRRKGARVEDGGVALDEFEGTSDTFAALSRAEAAATVMAILDKLGEDQRVVFALVELEQLSVPEVSKLLDINLNTAYSRLRLARTAFEAAVKKVRP
ncbi:MAG TPA: RNA polymerase sigma factor [Kofleriaceae bacterium]